MAVDEAEKNQLERVAARTRRAMVTVMIEGDDEQPVYIASGVLVRLAGVEFVLTAGHNVWRAPENRLERLSVSRMSTEITTHAKPGDGSTKRAFLPQTRSGEYPEPDVAVVEVSPTAILHPDRQPFEESEIGYFAPDALPRRLVLSGFPNRLLKVHDRIDLGSLGGRRPLDLFNMTTFTYSMPKRRFAKEPSEGRGVHVFLSKRVTDDAGVSSENISSVGMSGGPLVLPDGDGILVGLARSREPFENGHDEWCEPAVEALRLLTHHEKAEIASAAGRVVAQCGAPLDDRSVRAG